MQDQNEVTGRFSTPSAEKYLTQLCKHFGHKVPAQIEGNEGRVTFAHGQARLTANEAELTAMLSGPDNRALMTMRGIIDDHLKRFAFREEFTGMDWDRAD